VAPHNEDYTCDRICSEKPLNKQTATRMTKRKNNKTPGEYQISKVVIV
jgi:hypothetical protein